MSDKENIHQMNQMARMMGLSPLMTEPIELGQFVEISMMNLSGEPSAAMREFCYRMNQILREMERFVSDPSNRITRLNWDTFRIVTQPVFENSSFKISMGMRGLREVE